ncbi:hypothetical protein FRC14_000845, partial [Serendipita sp. 396]
MSSQDISTILAVTSPTDNKRKNKDGKNEEEEQTPLPRPTTTTNPTSSSSRLNEKRKPRQKPGEEWKKSEVHEIPH